MVTPYGCEPKFMSFVFLELLCRLLVLFDCSNLPDSTAVKLAKGSEVVSSPFGNSDCQCLTVVSSLL